MRADHWYVPLAPPETLSRLLACSWTAFPTGTHLLVPDACSDLLWTSHGEIWLCGPETTGWTFALPKGTTAVGVRLRPGMVPAVFGIDTSTLLNRRVRLGDVIGKHAECSVASVIAEATCADDRRLALESFVATLPVVKAHRDFAEQTLNRLTSWPRAPQSELASHLGLTPRQLHRKCTYGFGYGPSTLARIIRFHRFLAITEIDRPSVAWPIAAAAIDAGYTDQAHLGRDCRSITGRTPKKFLAEYFPTFPDMSDPYKTDATFDASVGA